MRTFFIKYWIVLGLFCRLASSQELAANSLGDFVKGLTNLISQNGGLGSLVNALPHPYPPSGSYPGYAPAYPGGSNHPGSQRPYRPGYQPPRPGYPGAYPAGGYGEGYPTPGQAGYPPPGYRPPPPALPPGLYPGEGYYPPNQGAYQQGFLSALASIARNDELRCVPRLLCEVTSGGKPGYPSYASQSTRDTITTLLTVLNFMDDNPLFIFGRAALLGAAARGNSAACLQAYPTCPRDPDRLVGYLNNHNGGFFRFFGGLPGQQRGQESAGVDGKVEGTEEETEPRIQTRPSYQSPPAVHYPTRQPHSPYFQQFENPAFRPVEPQDYLPPSAHGGQGDAFGSSSSSSRLVFPVESAGSRPGGRGGKQLAFPQETTTFRSDYSLYKPSYSPPQNLINFRDQRSVKFPSNSGKMSFPEDREP